MNTDPALSTVTTLKAPVEETLSFIHYYLNSGIDRMYLFFDDPNDRAISQIENNDRLTIFRCDEAHWTELGISPESKIQDKQEKNATLAFHLARKAGIEWIIYVDHDELIYGPERIKKYFSSVSDDIDIIRFPVMEAVPQKKYYTNAFSEINYFKVFDALSVSIDRFSTSEENKTLQYNNAKWWYRKRRAAQLLGSKHAKYHFGKNFLHGHQMGKSATRTTTDISSLKSHLPKPAGKSIPEMKVSQLFYVLHYDCMGFESWKKKWRDRVAKNLWTEVLSDGRKELHNKIKKAFPDEDKLIGLYNELYYLSPYELMLLRSFGLIKSIKLSDSLFKRDFDLP